MLTHPQVVTYYIINALYSVQRGSELEHNSFSLDRTQSDSLTPSHANLEVLKKKAQNNLEIRTSNLGD